MENSISIDDLSKSSSKQSSSKDSLTTIKGSKKLEKRSSNTGSFKAEKDVQFAIDKDSSSNKQVTADDKPVIDASLKVPQKFIANWRKACDHTRDKTKDLLKRWRTLPEYEVNENKQQAAKTSGWSVHVWTTWVDRLSLNNSGPWDQSEENILTPTQRSKFTHFFTCLLDHDCDEVISNQDFEALSEDLKWEVCCTSL